MPSRRLFVLLVAAAMLLSACAGDVLSRGAACGSGINPELGVSGRCTRAYEELEQETLERIGINTNDVLPRVSVEYELTVERGTVSIAFETLGGTTVTSTAGPGRPISGQVQMTLNALSQLTFRLVPENGPAANVAYVIKFACECVP